MLVYVSEHVKSRRRMDLEDDAMEAVWVEVYTKRAKVMIGNVYRLPDSGAGWINDFTVMMETAASEQID